jgi:hypothetical protein
MKISLLGDQDKERRPKLDQAIHSKESLEAAILSQFIVQTVVVVVVVYSYPGPSPKLRHWIEVQVS